MVGGWWFGFGFGFEVLAFVKGKWESSLAQIG